MQTKTIPMSARTFRLSIRLVALATAFLLLGSALLGSVASAAPAKAAPFSDVPKSHWAYDYIAAAYEDGAIKGTTPQTFAPSKTLTLGEFTTILVRAFYPEELAASTAGDSPWYARAMDVAQQKGLFKLAYSENPVKEITRSNMAAIINVLLADKGLPALTESQLSEIRNKIPAEAGAEYRDIPTIAPSYYYGIIAGVDDTGRFAPYASVDRAQAATIYTRLKDVIAQYGAVTPTQTPSQPTTPPVQTPEQPTTQPTTTGDTTFAFLDGETTVDEMMARINAATPPYREGYLTNGKPITNDNINEMLDELAQTWPEETEWTGGTKYRYSINPKWIEAWGVVHNGGCGAFAACVSDILFGEDAPIIKRKRQI